MNGYYSAAGQCHAACEILIANQGGSAQIRERGVTSWVDAKKVNALQDNERFVSILWAGGWDEYIVDASQVRDMTLAEMEQGCHAVAKGSGLPPLIYEGNDFWLRGAFTKACQEN